MYRPAVFARQNAGRITVLPADRWKQKAVGGLVAAPTARRPAWLGVGRVLAPSLASCPAGLRPRPAFPPDLSRLQSAGTEVLDRDGRTLSRAAGAGRRLAACAPGRRCRRRICSTCWSPSRTGASGSIPASIRWRWRAPRCNGRGPGGSSPAARPSPCRRRGCWSRGRARLRSKAIEMARALQLEARYGKDEMLGIWLTLAPYRRQSRRRAGRGARLVRPARRRGSTRPRRRCWSPSRAGPRRCAPTATRTRARAARDALLTGRAAGAPASPPPIPIRAAAPVPPPACPCRARRRTGRGWRAAPRAAHRQHARPAAAARRWSGSPATRAADPAGARLARHAGRRCASPRGPRRSTAATWAPSGRAGALDLTRAVRSPGSALKPFIYALAFEDGIAAPETVLADLPRRFGGYAPENFDRGFAGRDHRGGCAAPLAEPAGGGAAGRSRAAALRRCAHARRGRRCGCPPGADPSLPLALGGARDHAAGDGGALCRAGRRTAGPRPLRLRAGAEAAPRRVFEPRAAAPGRRILVQPFPGRRAAGRRLEDRHELGRPGCLGVRLRLRSTSSASGSGGRMARRCPARPARARAAAAGPGIRAAAAAAARGAAAPSPPRPAAAEALTGCGCCSRRPGRC